MKAFYSLLFAFFIFYSSYAQEFVNLYGIDTISDYGRSVKTANGYTFLAGYSESGSLGGADFTLKKIDKSGNLIWTKYFGTSGQDILTDMLITHEGDIVMAGEKVISISDKDILLIKVDTLGMEIWNKTYGSPTVIEASSHLSHTADHGYLLAGIYNDVNGATGNDMYFIKFDIDGNFVFDKYIPEAKNDAAMSIHEGTDGKYYLVGDSDSYSAPGGSGLFYDVNILVYCFDSTLLEEWMLLVGDTLSNGCQSSMIDNDNTIYVVGETYIQGTSEYQAEFFKVSPAGNLLWERKLGGVGREACFSMAKINNGFLLTGYSNSNSNGTLPTDVFLLHTDTAGYDLNWQYFGFSQIDISYSILYQNNMVLMAGTSNQGSDTQMLLISEDVSQLGIKSKGNEPANAPILIPNPVERQGLIYINVPISSELSINIWDNTGKNIKQGDYTYNTDNQTININDLADGLYYIEVISGEKKYREKFVIKN